MFQPPSEIRTDRLLLRFYTEGDFDALYKIQSREDVVLYLYEERFTPEATAESLRKKMTRTSLAKEGDALQYAVTLPETGELLGDVLLVYTSEAHRGGEIGYVLHPDHQGKGYAREAAVQMLRIGFDEVGLHRIIARLDAANTGSANLAAKLGMRREATFVRNEFVKGRWADEAVYAMLEEEWRELGSR